MVSGLIIFIIFYLLHRITRVVSSSCSDVDSLSGTRASSTFVASSSYHFSLHPTASSTTHQIDSSDTLILNPGASYQLSQVNCIDFEFRKAPAPFLSTRPFRLRHLQSTNSIPPINPTSLTRVYQLLDFPLSNVHFRSSICKAGNYCPSLKLTYRTSAAAQVLPDPSASYPTQHHHPHQIRGSPLVDAPALALPSCRQLSTARR
jgi:hypothetical protein